MGKILLDLFCGAGGAAMGYYRAGFKTIIGVDHKPQPHYPFVFVQSDAMDYLQQYGHNFDVIHASPVCQGHSVLNRIHKRVYFDYIAPLRDALRNTGKPYIIENVQEAPLYNYLLLCGSMFGLRVQRHRIFECNPMLIFPPATCNHWGKASGCRHVKGQDKKHRSLKNFAFLTITGHDFILADASKAMGIEWMNQAEISQAIPPAYTEFVGREILRRTA